MFTFTIKNTTTNSVYTFENKTEDLGIKDTYRFLNWLDKSEVNLPIREIHKLIKSGSCDGYTLTVSKASNDLTLGN